ncbi:amidohydrolase family protein [Salibacteraceae bacterium]|nr:amidohydrolase family protein [Salibacteraceae bacterium]
MKNWIIISFVLCSLQGLKSQETFPVNGVNDPRQALHAFTNAIVYVSADVRMEKATLLVQDGKVVSVATSGKVPNNAIEHDCSGKTIYPSFIDIYSGLNVEKKTQKKGKTPDSKPAANWNPAIHPEYNYEPTVPINKKKEQDWLKSGFGVVNLHHRDGIMRGSSTLLFLGQSKPNEAVLKSRATQHYSFSKGTSPNDYPSSHIGAIALIRQTLYDAQWYSSFSDNRPEYNPSLDAINKTLNEPKIFELNHSLSARNVQDISSEFDRPFFMVATGKEYLVLDELDPSATFILPLSYPKALDVKDPYMARMVSLAELKHWEAAPFNAYFLSENGNSICFSRDTVASGKEFLSNLRKTIESGVSHANALRALTETPATLLGISAKCGTLSQGKWANFIITNTTIDQKDFLVLDHWTKGENAYSGGALEEGMVGKYNLVIEKVDYTVEVKSVTEKGPKATISKVEDDFKLKVDISRNDDLLSLLITTEPKEESKGELLYSLSGKVSFEGGVWDGRGVDVNGNWVEWAAIKDRKSGEKEEKSDTTELDSLIIPAIWHPNGAYGWDSTSDSKTFVITNAVIWTAADTGIIDRGDVYVVDGKIKQIGKDILFPSDVKRINANGRHLTPGIIDEHSHIGIRGGVNEWARASSSEVRISDAVDPWNINIYRQLAGGVTSAQLLHGSANPIGGQSALIKLKWGSSANEMLIDNAPKFIKFALGENVKRSNRTNSGNRFPLTRMGVEQSIGDAFVRAHEYAPGAMVNGSIVRRDLQLDALTEILNDDRYISCHSYVQSEILMLMNLADSLGFRINTFTHILEGYKVSEELKAHGAMASTFSDWWAYKFEVNDAIPYNAAMLTNAGIVTAINSDDAEMGRRLNQEAAKTMKYGGLSEEEAIKLITINPAIMLHLDTTTGSIEVGKDADLVLWTDNPLSVYSQVDKTFIEGQLYFDRNKEAELAERIKTERSRLISAMILDKSEKKKKPKHQEEKHMHCDTLLDDYTQE